MQTQNWCNWLCCVCWRLLWTALVWMEINAPQLLCLLPPCSVVLSSRRMLLHWSLPLAVTKKFTWLRWSRQKWIALVQPVPSHGRGCTRCPMFLSGKIRKWETGISFPKLWMSRTCNWGLFLHCTCFKTLSLVSRTRRKWILHVNFNYVKILQIWAKDKSEQHC